MILFIEGVDGSGKTTLFKEIVDWCKKLKIKYNDDYISKIDTRPNSLNRVSYKDLIHNLKLAAKTDTLYIIDRGPISEVVYRVFDNEEQLVSMQDLIYIFNENEIIAKNSLIIYCDPNQEKSYNNMIQRGDDNIISINHHKELYKIYDIVISVLNNVFIYDYNENVDEASLYHNILPDFIDKEN